MKSLEELMVEARKIVMTDDERREQTASFAFGNLALTKEWMYKPESELIKLRMLCRQMAGCKPRNEVKLICGALSPGDWEEDPPVKCTREPHTEGLHEGGTMCGTLTWKNEREWR